MHPGKARYGKSEMASIHVKTQSRKVWNNKTARLEKRRICIPD